MKEPKDLPLQITPIRFFTALFGMYLLGMIAGYLACMFPLSIESVINVFI